MVAGIMKFSDRSIADAAIMLQITIVSHDDRVTSLDALMILQAAAGNINL